MRRNVSGQVIGCQLISKTDGSAVTSGTTTIYITGDGGTQTTGSVGSGACTHEGNGFWTYAPAQAETNFAHVGFTFVNSGACNVTVQVYPMAYDSSGQMTGVVVEASAVRTAVGLASANLDTQLGDLPTATENADALLNRDMSAVSDSNARSPLNALRAIRNKWGIAGTTYTVRKEDDTTTAWTAELSSSAGADPVTGSDPA